MVSLSLVKSSMVDEAPEVEGVVEILLIVRVQRDLRLDAPLSVLSAPSCLEVESQFIADLSEIVAESLELVDLSSGAEGVEFVMRSVESGA